MAKRGFALLQRADDEYDSNEAQNGLRERNYDYPKRPRGRVLLGGEIALLALCAIAGLWIAYEAFRKGRDTRMIRVSLLWAALALAGGAASAFSLLMLVIGLSG
jgi:hypothetical protein